MPHGNIPLKLKIPWGEMRSAPKTFSVQEAYPPLPRSLKPNCLMKKFLQKQVLMQFSVYKCVCVEGKYVGYWGNTLAL